MIAAEHLVKSHGGGAVLDDVSLQLADGSMTVLTGPSGSGKSTLLRILAGLDRPDAGVVTIDGTVASAPGVCLAPHRRGIGFVFQSPTLWPHMTVAANVAFAIPHGSKRDRDERALGLLGSVGVADLATRYPGEISQGQAHRVALARALAPEPRHLFLDEPLANLESPTRAALLDLIKQQVSGRDVAVLFVTHDREEMRHLGGNLLRLQDGRLAAMMTEDAG
ncbi:ABC transporter ATP-binding protein [Zhengella sp. ZM62]|uniref:ABC transporter ATP-binding protein n=1 Tax=Zhengella sedimenti TaxID=3390035 RepID=UPI00397667ED